MILEKKNIVLIGMTGVGKTTIGRILSKILRKGFIDIDFEIEKASGHKITDIFEKYGEDEFRILEGKVLSKNLDSLKNCVISTGAGILHNDAIVELVKKKSISIFLEIKISNLIHRLSNNLKNRPMLKKGDLKENLEKMLKIREINYNKADIKISVDGLSLTDIVGRIVQKLKSYE